MKKKGSFRAPGLVRWFRFEHYYEVESTIQVLQDLGVKKLRTALSWADWERPGGRQWFDWFISKIDSAGIEIFPSFFYTPRHRALLLPGEGRDCAKSSYPPACSDDYAQFCVDMVRRYGREIGQWCQIWNEPNNDAYWCPRHDPDHGRFALLAHAAIDALASSGRRIVLGGIIPPYIEWLRTMRRFAVLQRVHAVGIHAFPGTWDKMEWPGWPAAVQMVRDVLPNNQEVWITETGFSTVTLDDQSPDIQRLREAEQIRWFEEACAAPAEQVFWHSVHDQDLEHPTDNALHRGTTCDPRAYYFGLVSREGAKKPLYQHWRTRMRPRSGKDGLTEGVEHATTIPLASH